MAEKIESIVIVGGGSSGWMSAATLISQFPSKKITLVESPNYSTVGVGESTIAGITRWMNLIGVKDEEFMPPTDASYKTSIRFSDFYRKGSGSFHYPFGEIDLTGNYGNNDWFLKKALHPETDVSDYADCMFSNMALVNANKISKNEHGGFTSYDFEKHVAYHFDATKFGIWLRDQYCLPRGVIHKLSNVNSINQTADGISSIDLEDGTKLTADLFVDCTGFKSMLIGETLGVEFEVLDNLPNDCAWACQIPYQDKEKELQSFTNCTAIENGWCWNIPLWSRLGTGYVFSTKYVDKNDALEEFKNYLCSEQMAVPRTREQVESYNYKLVPFRSGIHKHLWVKNVVAIGLSAGFVEPLESSGLFTVHEFLFRLVRSLQRDYVTQWDKDTFSGSCRAQYKEFSEFVGMHYALSHRDDTAYWKDVGNRTYSKELNDAQPYFVNGYANAAFSKMRDYMFTGGGLHCIAAGMRWFPSDLPALTYFNYPRNTTPQQKIEIVAKNLDAKKQRWEELAKYELSLIDYLKTNIHKNVDL